MVKITTLGDSLEVGTRVHWDAPTQSLYYVDVPLSKVYRYHPPTERLTSAKVGAESLGFVFPVEGSDNEFIGALGRKFVTFEWDGESSAVSNCQCLGEVDCESAVAANRINGGKVDPWGRLWAGTMGPPDANGEIIPGRGSLFSVEHGKIRKHASEIGISNGLAFNVQLKKMYYVDTLFRGVYQYDYDPITGDIGNRSIIFNFAEHGIDGSPDGLTIDQDGNLWLAVIFGSAVVQFDPRTGELLKTLEIPTPEITAVTWGDKALNTLYVNTAKMPIDNKIPAQPAGSTFKVEGLNVKGLPGDRYKK